MWKDTAQLLTKVEAVDDQDNLIYNTTSREVFCKVKSIKMREFYEAAASNTNLKPEIIFVLRTMDYTNETEVLYENKNYYVIRTYSTGDNIELTCSGSNAEQLNKEIIIQAMQESRDTDGAVIKSWVTYCKAWARVQPLSGEEYLDKALSVDNSVVTKITIRYRTSIKPSMRILYRDQIYEIKSVINPNESDEILQLICKVVV